MAVEHVGTHTPPCIAERLSPHEAMMDQGAFARASAGTDAALTGTRGICPRNRSGLAAGEIARRRRVLCCGRERNGSLRMRLSAASAQNLIGNGSRPPGGPAR